MDSSAQVAMDSYANDLARRLEGAIASGELTAAATIEDSAGKLIELLDCDSLDLVELDMAIEERWTGPPTIRRLIELLRDIDPGEADSPLVKK